MSSFVERERERDRVKYGLDLDTYLSTKQMLNAEP